MDNLKLVAKVLKMYFIDNLTQAEIAKKLSISRIKVARLLYYARDHQMYEVKINIPLGDYNQLENTLEKKFNLKECRIVPYLSNIEELYKYLALELSEILNRVLLKNEYLGVSWGTTLEGVAKYLDLEKNKDVKVLPLCGEVGVDGVDYTINGITRMFANKLSSSYYTINTPGLLDTKETRKMVEKESTTQQIMHLIEKVSTAVLAVSDISLETSFGLLGKITEEDIAYLKELGIIGILNFEFLDKEGNPVINALTERIMRIFPLEKIRNTKNAILISFGPKKVDIMRAALKANHVNILLTDEATASAILEE
jgi:deoxyribonucleoside regulator